MFIIRVLCGFVRLLCKILILPYLHVEVFLLWLIEIKSFLSKCIQLHQAHILDNHIDDTLHLLEVLVKWLLLGIWNLLLVYFGESLQDWALYQHHIIVGMFQSTQL